MGLTESNAFVARRYDRLAPIFRLMELAFWMPPTLRRRTIAALDLHRGDRILEVGCGSGSNLPLLARAVGAGGTVVGTDISPGMLRHAEHLVDRCGLPNVTLVQQDAAQLSIDTPLDAILFSLSYSVMPNRQKALSLAWAALKPHGRLVIMDSGSFGPLGHLLRHPSRLLSRVTVLGDPDIRPWEELREHAPEVHTDVFQGGTYAICCATKPSAERSPR